MKKNKNRIGWNVNFWGGEKTYAYGNIKHENLKKKKMKKERGVWGFNLQRPILAKKV